MRECTERAALHCNVLVLLYTRTWQLATKRDCRRKQQLTNWGSQQMTKKMQRIACIEELLFRSRHVMYFSVGIIITMRMANLTSSLALFCARDPSLLRKLGRLFVVIVELLRSTLIPAVSFRNPIDSSWFFPLLRSKQLNLRFFKLRLSLRRFILKSAPMTPTLHAVINTHIINPIVIKKKKNNNKQNNA